MTAKPKKLRNGEWGALVEGNPKKGDVVTITTRNGKTWEANVSRVLWTGKGVAICATESLDRSRPRRRSQWCECGWGEDLLSWGGHVPGRIYRCPECGGKAEAC